jgi:hypothetical protein
MIKDYCIRADVARCCWFTDIDTAISMHKQNSEILYTECRFQLIVE